MPSVAEHELDEHHELVFEILRLRTWAHAKETYEQAKPEDQRKLVQSDPLMRLIEECEFERQGQRLKERRQKKAKKKADG